jgi:hypothetical protein
LPPLNLYARVRFFVHFLHTRPRVQRAPGFPCALFFEGKEIYQQTSGEMRRENASPRHCEEPLRRSNPLFLYAGRWIASLTLAMTAVKRSAYLDTDFG